MKKSVAFSALVLGVFLCSSVALAADPVRGINANNTTSGNFSPLGGQFCATPNLPFGAAPPSVQSTIPVAGQGGNVAGLEVELQIQHTWVGDISATLVSPNLTSQILIDRPGVPVTTCGCGSNNIDVTLADGNPTVENACILAPPAPAAITGTLGPAPGTLAAFNGGPADGNWTMTVADAFAVSDNGTFVSWCLNFGGTTTGGTTGGGTGGSGGSGGVGTPATSTWGVILLIALFLGASVFFLRRRSSASA